MTTSAARQLVPAVLALLILPLLMVFGCGSTAVKCSDVSQGCTSTSDCCQSNQVGIDLICAGNTCQSPGMCAGAMCSATVKCCSGYECVGTCVAATCGQPHSCSGGRSYKSCASTTKAFFKANDGTVFMCVSTTECTSATNAVVAWCM